MLHVLLRTSHLPVYLTYFTVHLTHSSSPVHLTSSHVPVPVNLTPFLFLLLTFQLLQVSVQLLLTFSIPVVLTLSWVVLKSRYQLLHILGLVTGVLSVVAMVGLLLLLLFLIKPYPCSNCCRRCGWMSGMARVGWGRVVTSVSWVTCWPSCLRPWPVFPRYPRQCRALPLLLHPGWCGTLPP